MPEKLAGIDRKWWLLGGGGAAIVVFFVYRRNKAAAASSTAATATSDPSIDPNSGVPYAQESGYGTAGFGTSQGGTSSLYGYQDPTTGQFIGLGTPQNTGSSVVLAPATNAAWAQQASALLTQHGYDELTVDAALGKYLAGMELTSDQLGIVQTAIGLEGQPPNPPSAPHTAPPPGQPGAAPVTIANGWYRDTITGAIWQVDNNVRYHLSLKSAKILDQNKQRPKSTAVLPTWQGYKLPQGRDI